MIPTALLLAVVVPAPAAFTPVAEVLRTDPALYTMTSGPPVAVRGIVTYVKRIGGRNLIIQDETGGLFIRNDRIPIPNAVEIGSILEVWGELFGGFFAPRVQANRIMVVGRAELPPTIRVSTDEFQSGRFDCCRVEMEGVVRRAVREETMIPPQLLLKVATPAGTFEAAVLEFGSDSGEWLVDATVRVRGVCIPWDNGRLQLRGFRVGVNELRTDVTVLDPATADPFSAPLVPPDRLTRYRPEGADPHRVRVRGIVTRTDPSEGLIVQVGTFGVRVRGAGPSIQPGDEVEAVGFADRSGFATDLGDAVVRLVGRGTPPIPIAIGPAETFERFRQEDLYLRLVQVRGTLRLVERTRSGVRLYLETDGVVFTAEFPHDEPAEGIDEYPPGCELALTGVCELRPPPRTLRLPGRPSGFVLLMRDRADVVMTDPGPWLTPARLRAALGVAALVIVVAVLWALALRRLARLRTTQLVREVAVRHDVEVETRAVAAERVRVAAELHDTLEQSLTGVALQLQAVALSADDRPDRAAEHLELARSLLDRGRQELRAAVQDLRASGSVPTDCLPAELLQVARGMSGRSGPIVAVQVVGEIRPVPEHVAYQTLRVAQEAITNAAKHAAATAVAVRLEFAREKLTLIVRDDGRGFDPAAVAGLEEGHYGIQGMRDRAKKISADFSLRSTPGGSTVTLRVPLPTERGRP